MTGSMLVAATPAVLTFHGKEISRRIVMVVTSLAVEVMLRDVSRLESSSCSPGGVPRCTSFFWHGGGSVQFLMYQCALMVLKKSVYNPFPLRAAK